VIAYFGRWLGEMAHPWIARRFEVSRFMSIKYGTGSKRPECAAAFRSAVIAGPEFKIRATLRRWIAAEPGLTWRNCESDWLRRELW